MPIGPTVLSPAPVGLTEGSPDRFLLGTGKSRPGGVEAYFQYNGATFNVRSWQDTFLITSIDGLADPDVRDTREVNPARHGETHFDAYYGGRTIVLTGRIRAGTIHKLRDMQQGLKQIFGDISREMPLYIRTNDPEKDVFINCKKSQPIVMAETQQNFNYTRDFQVTLRASDPFFLSYMEQRLIQSYQATLEEFSTNALFEGAINLSENPDGSATTGGIGTPAAGFYTREQFATYKYASPSGNDSTGDGTLAAPYATVQKLFNELAPGQTGVLRAGTYTAGAGTYVLDVTVGNSGTAGARKRLIAYPDETVIFSGRHTVRTGAGHVNFERIRFSGGANTLIEYYGSGTYFDQCEFTNTNASAIGVIVGSLANGWAVSNLKFTRCKFYNIGPVGTGALHHALYIDNTSYNPVNGRTIEVHNCTFTGMQGGYTIQLYRNAHGVWIHHNVFYNNYRGLILSADDPADPARSSRDNLIEYNIFHTTNAAVSPYGYHIAHYFEPPPAAGNYLGNEVNFNILWNPAHDPDNNGGIHLDSGDTQGFDQHGNQEIDPGFSSPGTGNFTTSAPAAVGRGLTTPHNDIGTAGAWPQTPLKVNSFALDAFMLSSAQYVELAHRKNDGNVFPCDPGDRVAVRARITAAHTGLASHSAHVYFYNAAGNMIWNEAIATGVVPNASGTWVSGITDEAPAGTVGFEFVAFASADMSATLIPNTRLGVEKVLLTLNPPLLGDAPKWFSGSAGGVWLGTAGSSASQGMSVTGIEGYDLYSAYFLDPEAAPPDIYVQSGRLRNYETNTVFRFIRRDAPNVASLNQSITYYTGANVVRSGGYTGIILKWTNDQNFIFARVLYTNATAQLQFFKVVDNVAFQLGTDTNIVSALAAGTGYKLLADISGNVLSMTHQRVDGTQVTNKTYTLVGDEITRFGAAVIGEYGFVIGHSSQSMTDWQWDDHSFEAASTADILAFSATNEGNAPARTKLRINGPLTAAVNNGPALKITARFTDSHGDQQATVQQINAYGGTTNAIPADHYLEIDSLARTIKEYDEDGVFVRNAYEQLDITSEWIDLGADGDTDFELQTYTANRPILELAYRHTFL